MTVTDTSDAANAVLAQVYRRMTPAEKLAIVVEMCEESREIARGGIRARHPEYDAAEVEHALHRLLLGDALADRVWPAFAHLVP